MVTRTVKRALRPVITPWTSAARITADLRRLGVAAGGILVVHSSLSSLGYVRGGAHAVLEALRSAIGPDGTLVLPTLTFRQMNDGCRIFDVRHTKSCVGTLTETFRCVPGVRRSLHPTHSIAASGPLAEYLVEGHEMASTPCGDGTPYAKILEANGQALLLGVGLKSLTVFHTVETLAHVPYHMQEEEETFTLVDISGREHSVRLRRHRRDVSRCYGSMEPFLAQEGALWRGAVGAAPSMLVQGLRFRELMVQRLRSEPALLLAK